MTTTTTTTRQDLVLRDIMTKQLATLDRSASMYDAARLMREKNIGGVVITESDGALCGFITDRDLIVRGIALGRDPGDTTLDSLCTHDVTQLSPDDSLDRAVKLMAAKAIRRIPVVEKGRAVGIVSMGDLAQVRDERSALGSVSAARPNL